MLSALSSRAAAWKAGRFCVAIAWSEVMIEPKWLTVISLLSPCSPPWLMPVLEPVPVWSLP
jgi:hypothetical protein